MSTLPAFCLYQALHLYEESFRTLCLSSPIDDASQSTSGEFDKQYNISIDITWCLLYETESACSLLQVSAEQAFLGSGGTGRWFHQN